MGTEWYSAQRAPRVEGSIPALKTPGSQSFLSTPIHSAGLVTDQGAPLLAPEAVWTHLERGGLGAARAGALPARRSSSRLPACCSGPESLLQTASAGLSPIAEKGHGRGGCEPKTYSYKGHSLHGTMSGVLASHPLLPLPSGNCHLNLAILKQRAVITAQG